MDEEGEGVAVFGGAAANSGDDAGDCATAEKTNIATSRRSRVEENAILRG